VILTQTASATQSAAEMMIDGTRSSDGTTSLGAATTTILVDEHYTSLSYLFISSQFVDFMKNVTHLGDEHEGNFRWWQFIGLFIAAPIIFFSLYFQSKF
jgi:hypothetical protein